jgi:hypothetical protein
MAVGITADQRVWIEVIGDDRTILVVKSPAGLLGRLG